MAPLFSVNRRELVGITKKPQLVKLIVGLISSELNLFSAVQGELIELFGLVDLKSSLIPFSFTNYYASELGLNLQKKFLSFRTLIHPGKLFEIKTLTNEIEIKFQLQNNKRRINIDPGYLETGKFVLATTKNQQHRIYLGKGIYGEVTLRFKKGRFEPWEWTYPDYASGVYFEFFSKVRELYLEQLSRQRG